ncbi:MAG: 50S ribosomal protein L30 [Magnetococcales bacterium]|nr:50S ribosomal protein L30 [Magnetococcales bacterium]MBF0415070.1 50S ribosomal protein L30 [Magnetococcales bacterium]MBF0419158.1 50S ribosomal protein L30 [Magnetococcales bacterium]MBF0434981.1 50S ribosomal protein L30 [Magnetococcales bacterium]
MSRTIKVQKIRSIIGRPEKHRRIMEALGLRKIRQVRELPDNPSVRGMVNKVIHLVQVLEG